MRTPTTTAFLAFLIAASVGIVDSFAVSNLKLKYSKRHKTVLRMSGKAEGSGEKIKSKTWNPFSLMVLKVGLTEPAWTSPFNYQKRDGVFSCAFCGEALFDSNAKYDSGSGWPSFWRTITDGAVALKTEWDGRVECSCSRCGGHLGHVFMDGPNRGSMPRELVDTIPDGDPKPRTGSRLPRFCVNGVALKFSKSDP